MGARLQTEEEGNIEGKGRGVNRWKKEQKVKGGMIQQEEKQGKQKKEEGESVVQEKEEKDKGLMFNSCGNHI